MDVNKYVARFMVHKIGSFVVKERVLCFGENGFSTYDPDTQMLTNTWSYQEVERSSPMDGETDFVIHTPRHRVKKTVYRCHYRMEVLVCVMRLRRQYQARSPGQALRAELQTIEFPCRKYHKRGLQSACVVEICPDGVYQKDGEGEAISRIPYTSLVSIDIICDSHEAIQLNHSDNSSLFLVDRRTDMAQAIHRVMRAYGMDINEYRKKTMEAARRDDAVTQLQQQNEGVSFQYAVTKLSSSNQTRGARMLSVSEKYVAELALDSDTVISSRPLTRIFNVILFEDSRDTFEIVFVDGVCRTFQTAQRERVVSELVASCFALKGWAIDVVTARTPEASRMVPRHVIESEGSGGAGSTRSEAQKHAAGRARELNGMNRELRVVQSCVLQQLVAHGSRKTARMQRQLPLGVDDEMHALALELNANTMPLGVIAQPNKPFEKVTFYIAREIRDLVSRHGPRHAFLATYFQTLHRLMQAPQAMKEFVAILLERGDEYVTMIAEILVSRRSVIVYWTLMVLQRLLESKTYRIQTRAFLVGKNIFLSSLLSLFDADSKTGTFLSDLPTMKLCQFVFSLVTINTEQQKALSKTLYEHLARKHRMLHRILFSFPCLATVEACVGILSRMTNSPSVVSFDESLPSLVDATLLASAVQPPPLSLTFGEHLTYDATTARPGKRIASHRVLSMSYSRRTGSNNRSFRSGRMMPLAPASNGPSNTSASGVVVRNPEVLLRQYRLFLDSTCGPKQKPIAHYREAVFLRLRYRCRNTFLQELISHLSGSFEEFKRVFAVECHRFSGFLGKVSGQREKSELYLTPRALIVLRVLNGYTQEFEYRCMDSLHIASQYPDAVALTVKGKLRYIYSDSCADLVQTMRDVAGVIGVHLPCIHVSQLPKRTCEQQPSAKASRYQTRASPTSDSLSSLSRFDVVKRGGRRGNFRLRKKQVTVINDVLHEYDPESSKDKAFVLKDLRRITAPRPSSTDSSEIVVSLDFANDLRLAYVCSDDVMDCLIAQVYDGCWHASNRWVTLTPEFSRVNPRLTLRAMLRDAHERAVFLNKDGLYVSSHAELTKELAKMTSDVVPMASAMDRVVFALENVNMNIEESDFTSQIVDSRISQLHFQSILQGMSLLLQHSSKAPMRVNEVCILLEAFTRINDGCYRLSREVDTVVIEFASLVVRVLETSDDPMAILWGVRVLHSIVVDKSEIAARQRPAEKHARAIILAMDHVIASVIGILDQNIPLCSIAVLELLIDVLNKSRINTDNNHFDAIIKRLATNYGCLLHLAEQSEVVGLAVTATSLLRIILEHGDARARQRISDTALQNGLTLQSLYHAFFHSSDAGRATYRYIASMWILHHRTSFELLKRMLPHGLIRMLSTPMTRKMVLHDRDRGSFKRPSIERNGKSRRRREIDARGGFSECFIRRMRQEIAEHSSSATRHVKAKDDGTRANYPGESTGDVALLADLIHQDFLLPDVIWNAQTREELKLAMETCIDRIRMAGNRLQSSFARSSSTGTASSSAISPMTVTIWNHAQFEVTYPSIASDLQVGPVFLRVLLSRIHDGSLQLDHVAKAWQSMNVANGGVGKSKTAFSTNGEAGHLLHSSTEIAKDPVTFFKDVYQSWLEQLHIQANTRQGTSVFASATSNGDMQFSISELIGVNGAANGFNAASEMNHVLLKALTVTARAFPSARPMPTRRVHFLVDVVMNSFSPNEVKGLVELLAAIVSEPAVTRALCSEQTVAIFVAMATLCHRQSQYLHLDQSRACDGDDDEVPLMGTMLSEDASVSSMPLTHLSNASRMKLKWRARISGTDPGTITDESFSTLELKQQIDQQRGIMRVGRDMYVCCCTIHEKHDSDIHDWRPLYQTPELRWMELMDEPMDDAGGVGAHGLEILRGILSNEPDAVVNGACVVPLPTGKKLLSAKPALSILVQLLLVENATVRKTVSQILLAMGPGVAPSFFECGLFFFLFAVDVGASSMKSDDTFVEEARLLQSIHRVQKTSEVRAGQSYLMDMLPEPLINILDTESAEVFAAVFTNQTVDQRVLWTSSMRAHLRELVREHIEEFDEDLRRDVAATYRYVSLPPVKYKEMSRDVYCGGYFLSTIVETEAASLEAIEEPQALMSAIEDKWLSLVDRHAATLSGVERDSAYAFKVFGWKRWDSFTMQGLRARYRDLCKKDMEVTTVRAAYEVLCRLLERKNEMDTGRTSNDVIRTILLSQQRLLQLYNFQFFSFESKVLPLLLALISSAWSRDEDEEGDDTDADELDADAADRKLNNAIAERDEAEFRSLGMKILHSLLSTAPLNLDKLLTLDNAWTVLLDMVDSFISSDDLAGKEAAFSILQLVVSAENGPRSLLYDPSALGNEALPSSGFERLDSDASDENRTVSSLLDPAIYQSSHQMLQETPQSKRLCAVLDNLLAGQEQRQSWHIQESLFGIVLSLCRCNELQNQLVESTKVFWRALYVLLSAAGDTGKFANPPTQGADSTADAVAKQERDVVESAFLSLRAMSIGLDGESRSQGLDALANLLPMQFLDCLDRASGHDFWTILGSDIREPTCIWNEWTKSELMQLLADHCDDQNEDELSFLESATSYMYDCLKCEPLVGAIYLQVLLEKADIDPQAITAESLFPSTPVEFVTALFEFLNENRDPTLGIYADTLPALECLNILVDLPVFRDALVETLELYGDEDNAEEESVSVATLGRYLLPYDSADASGVGSISSRRSLSSYGFMSATGGTTAQLEGLPEGMEAEFGNVDYLNRQEFALLILNKICGFECSLEKILAPLCRYTWSLQVITDHLDYEQAFYALSCLAELCDTCLVVAEYVEQSGLWVEILGIAIQSRQHVLHEHFLRAEALREPAFEVLYALLSKDFAIRERMYSGLCRFLPYPLVYQIHLDPSQTTQFFDDNHEKSDLIWNSRWRTEVRRKVDQVICRNRIERTKAKRDSVILDEDDVVHLPGNFVAGMYLDQFLARPDPEQLTNPAYNLELLFQEWTEKLHCLMEFDLENPPDFLKELGQEVENLATAMTHILRASLEIDESIQAFQMPTEVIKLVRYCNKHVIAGFPYRCTLRVARRLTQFPEMQSKDFLELLFCRITVDHADIPALVKVVRRVLEARAQTMESTNHAVTDAFVLMDLKYFLPMVAFLESVVEKKGDVDGKVLSNVNRILRIIKAEKRSGTRENHPLSQSFFQRASARWHNFTLTEMRSTQMDVDERGAGTNGPGSFDVDQEHDPSGIRGTFDVDAERAAEIGIPPPPKSLIFDGEHVHEVPPAPASFRYVNGAKDDTEESLPPARASTIRAAYEPVDTQYHSSKAIEYSHHEDVLDRSRRASMSSIATADVPSLDIGRLGTGAASSAQISTDQPSLRSSDFGSSRRFSLLDSWRAPTSNQANPLLSSLTISARGRRAAAVYSRRKSKAPKRWFGK